MTVAEEKIAKSSGNETEKYSKALEDETDRLINQVYHPEKLEAEETENKEKEAAKEATKDPEKKELPPEEKSPGEETEQTAKKEEQEIEEIVADDNDTIEALREKLAKSENRRKNTTSEFTKREQRERDKEKEAKAVIDALNQTIANLKTTSDKTTETKSQEVAQDKEVKSGLADLGEQFKTLENIDPDIAKPLKTLFEGMASQITGLQTELKSTAEKFNQSTAISSEEIHFGKIERAHPGYEQLIDSDEFNSWLDSLPSYMSKITRDKVDKDGSAEEVIEIFDTYKSTLKDQTDTSRLTQKEEKLKLAENLTGPDKEKSKFIKQDTIPTTKYTRKMLRAMSKEEYAEKEADIDKEAAAGRIPNE
jgi:hypothetical protein